MMPQFILITFNIALIFQSLYFVIFDGSSNFLLATLTLLLIQTIKQPWLKYIAILSILYLCYFSSFFLALLILISYSRKKLVLLSIFIILTIIQIQYQQQLVTQANDGETWQKYGAL